MVVCQLILCVWYPMRPLCSFATNPFYTTLVKRKSTNCISLSSLVHTYLYHFQLINTNNHPTPYLTCHTHIVWKINFTSRDFKIPNLSLLFMFTNVGIAAVFFFYFFQPFFHSFVTYEIRYTPSFYQQYSSFWFPYCRHQKSLGK